MKYYTKANTMKGKGKCYEKIQKKLCSKTIAPKYYWSLLKTMLNDKKVPCIPPIFLNNKFVTDFSKKADLVNSFFAKHCSIIENNRRMILKESSVNSIVIKLMVMI